MYFRQVKLYFPSINMLRGLAALLVCLYHFTNYTSPDGSLLATDDPVRQIGELGINGVFIFFVISGFVIPISMYNGKYAINRLPRFLVRRWIRIEIPYIASILAFLVVFYISCRMYMWNFDFEPMRFLHHITYTVPFTDYDWYNVIYWTLAIEFQFYIIIAVLYPLFVHKNAAVRYGSLLVFGLSGILITNHSIFCHYGPIFGMGIALFLLKSGKMKDLEALLFVLLFAGVTAYTHDWVIATFAIATTALIAFVTIDNKLFNKLGDISYSLYLIHGIVGGNLLFIFSRYVDSYAGKLVLILLVTVASIASSYLFWWLIENPSKKLSKKIKV